MFGLEITYNGKDKYAIVLLNHTVFGRLCYRNYRGRKYAYYMPGILDAVKFIRLTEGKIFVPTNQPFPNFSEYLTIFGEYKIEEKDFPNISYEQLTTGEEYWRNKANVKELPFRKRRSRRSRNVWKTFKYIESNRNGAR